MSRTDTVEITTDAPGFPVVVHRPKHDSFDMGAFCAGVFATLLVMWLIRRRAAKLVRDADLHRADPAVERDYSELARRTAALERIVTEPAARLDREIDALR